MVQNLLIEKHKNNKKVIYEANIVYLIALKELLKAKIIMLIKDFIMLMLLC